MISGRQEKFLEALMGWVATDDGLVNCPYCTTKGTYQPWSWKPVHHTDTESEDTCRYIFLEWEGLVRHDS